MTLTDAGALVALIDADEADHEVCRLVLDGLRLPLVTTWPATEAMYLLSRVGGQTGRDALWKLTLSGRAKSPTWPGRPWSERPPALRCSRGASGTPSGVVLAADASDQTGEALLPLAPRSLLHVHIRDLLVVAA